MAPALRSEGVRGVLVLGALAVLLVALAIVYFAVAKARSREETCQLNLKLLGIEINGASPAAASAWDLVPAGGAFWTEHQKWPITPVRPIRQQMLLCPVRGSVKGRSGTDFRGPATSLRRLTADDPIGADRVGNHDRGGNVLLRDGNVYHCEDNGHAVWVKAAGTTTE